MRRQNVFMVVMTTLCLALACFIFDGFPAVMTAKYQTQSEGSGKSKAQKFILHKKPQTILNNTQTANNVIRRNDDMVVYNWNGYWTRSSVCENINVTDFTLASLNTISGETPIYVYKEKDDKWVSKDLIHHGRWENHIASPIINMLMKDPTLTFIDIGANLGVFSLEVAKLGRKVISVEPLRNNVVRFCSSVRRGKLSKLVTLVFNAVSNKHQRVTLGKDLNNVGGTFVIKDNPMKIAKSNITGQYRDMVNAILLDDILSLPDRPERVVIKIDVEGYEHFVLDGGTYFFRNVYVKAVVMEWTYSNNVEVRDLIVKFMVKNNFLPYTLRMRKHILQESYDSWPNTIVWLNKT